LPQKSRPEATPEKQSTSNSLNPWSKVWCVLIKSDSQSETKTESIHAVSPSTAANKPESRKPKILLIDSDSDRKARIAILKNHGFMVYPALAIQQARSRCRSGAYDLIIVNASNQDSAVEFCDEIRKDLPQQKVLMIMSEKPSAGSDDRAVAGNPEQLLASVESLFQTSGSNSQPRAA
jgi:PleD family two-component response regulator